MNIKKSFKVVSVAAAFLFLAINANASELSAPRGELYKEKEVIVKWKEYIEDDDLSIKIQRTMKRAPKSLKQGALKVKADYQKRNFSVISSTHLSTEELIEKFEKLPTVEYVHENIIFKAQAQTVPWGVDDSAGVKARSANQSGYTGDGVVVAVLDTGVDLDHEDLDDNIWSGVGYDFANNDSDPTDDNGHGTHVSGIIAAEDNDTGVVGVAPGASIMAVKVLSSNGSGSYSGVVEGIDYAVDNGANVINMSFGAVSAVSVLKDLQDAIHDAESAGVTVVAATGNYSSNSAFIPSMFENVISVGSVAETATANNPTENFNTRLSYFSNWGKVNVVAPGSLINSTISNGSYSGAAWDGTSMAAPHVAGVAALLKGKSSSITPAKVRFILENTASDLGDTGKDEFFGSGLVDAQAALDSLDSTDKSIVLEANWSDDSARDYSSDYYYEPVVYSSMLPADGATTTNIRVFVKNEDGTPAGNEVVTLATTDGTISAASPFTTDSTGIAQFSLQSSTTPGKVTVTATIDSTSESKSIVMRFADTLLISDAGQPIDPGNEGWFYYQALENVGADWKASAEAYSFWGENMDDYDKVIWHTEGYSLNTTEQNLIKDYLDQGGNIFISGGDILYTYYYYSTYGGVASLAEDIIFSDYLKIAYSHYYANTLFLVGDNNFEGLGADINDYESIDNNSYFSDVVLVQPSGIAEGYYCSNTEVALVTVDSTYKSAFLGTALEVVGKTNREQIIDNALDYLNGDAQSGGTYNIPIICDSSLTENDGIVEDPVYTNGEENGMPVPGLPDNSSDLTDNVIYDVAVDSIDNSRATVVWQTDEDINSSIVYAENLSTLETEAFGAGDTATATVENLHADTQYKFTVYGVYADGSMTGGASVTDVTYPSAPSKPSLKTKTRKKIIVRLEDPADTGYQFRVELSDRRKEITEVQVLDVGATETIFSNLKAGTQYYTRAKLVYLDSESNEVSSEYSDYLAVASYSDQVRKLKVLKRKKKKVKIQWKKPKGKISKYTIQLWKKRNYNYSHIKSIKIKKNLRSPRNKWVKKLKPGVKYKLRIKTKFKNGDLGGYSKYLKFRTRK